MIVLAHASVVPSATVSAGGAVAEVNDGRGRRLLAAEPELAVYARALLACALDHAAFVWVDRGRRWHAIRIERLPHGEGREPRALVEAVETEPPHGLTRHELDVLTLVAGGLTNPEIGAHLGSSTRTVSTHVQRILPKLGQATRAGAAAMAIEQGLLRLPLAGGAHHLAGLAVSRLDAWARRGATSSPRARARARPRPRPYLIGSAYPAAGSGEGAELRRGSQLAIDEINARGGIAGRPVEQLVVDLDVTAASGLSEAFRPLLAAEVDAITLGYSLATELSDWGAVGEYGCPLLSAMTSEALTEWVRDHHGRSDRVFQVGPTEIHYGAGAVRFADGLARSGAWQPRNRGIVFVETAADSGHVAGPETVDAAERAGWSVEAVLDVATHDADWEPVLARIRRDAPAVVVVAHFVAAEMAAFQRAFAADPAESLVYGIYAPSVPEYLELAGPAADGVLWATVTGSYGDMIGGAFARRYEAAFGARPGRGMAGSAYDQVNLLAAAWASVENPRAFAEVGDALRRTAHRGVNGTYVLGHARQCGLAYPDETPDPSVGQAHLVFQVQDGEQRILDPLPYADGTFRLPPWLAGGGR